MNAKQDIASIRIDAQKKAAFARLVRSTSELVRNVFAPSGCVRTGFLAEIDALPDTEAAIRAYAVTLGPRIAAAVHEEVRDTFARARDAAAAMNARGRRPKPSAPPAVVRFAAETMVLSLVNETLFSRMRNVFFGGVFGCTIGQVLGIACFKCGFRSAAPVVSFVCAVLGLVGGYVDMRRRSCHGHKAKLVAHVNAILADLQAKYATPTRVGALSEIDRCLAVLCGTAPDRLPTQFRKAERTRQTPPEAAASAERSTDSRVGRLTAGLGRLRDGTVDLADRAKARIHLSCARAGERLSQSTNMKKLRQIVEIIRS